MKIRQKRISASLLALSLTSALALSACGNDNEGGASPSATASPAASAAASPSTGTQLAPYQVSIYMPGSPQKDQAAVEEKLAQLLKDKVPNTTVKVNYLDWGAYGEKTNLMLQSGEPLDLVFAAEWLSFFSNAAKGAFIALDDGSIPQGSLLKQYGQGIQSTLDPTFLFGPVVNGKLYAIPTNKELSQGRGFAFRKDIVEKYGFDISTVKELKDIEPFIKVIKEKEPNIYPVYSNKQDSVLDFNQDFGFQEMGFGAYINRNGDSSKVISITDPSYYEIELKQTSRLHKWYEEGLLNKSAPTTQEKMEDVRNAGKIWFMPTTTQPGREAALRNKNTSGSGPEYFEWVIVNTQAPLVTTNAATGSQMAIARSSKDPARAMMVLDQLYTNKELLNTLVFGLEGKHFEKLGSNKIKQIPDSGYNPGNGWIIGNQLNNYLLDNELDNKWEEYKTFNKTAEKSPLLGFTFNSEPVKTQVASYNTIMEEYRDILRTGPADAAETLKKRNEKMEKGGIQDIVKEMQKQVDDWKAKNGK